MTDQLREALAWWERMKGQTRFRQPIYVAFDAARWKLEFPTDAQVEAAARAIDREMRNYRSTVESRSETHLRLARAALEAAHNTGKDGP